MIPLLIGPVAELANTVLKRVLPAEKMTEIERANLEQTFTLELMKADWQGVAGQLAINQEEAKSDKWWVAGWRPAVGWSCAAAFAWTYVGAPFCNYFIAVTGHTAPALPALDIGGFMPVLLGMLGLGGLRSWEKVKKIGAGK